MNIHTTTSTFQPNLSSLVAIALLISIHPLLCRGANGRIEADLSGSGWKLWQDKDAKWAHDELFLPPVDLTRVPSNSPGGGWDKLQSGEARDVSVPSTAEEYLQTTPGPSGDIKGVTWWTRTIQLPASAATKRILLRFDSARLRSEIYVNQKLVGYDVIGNTPFEVDLTGSVQPGEKFQLAVRITDPGGNFDWHDSSSFQWGKYKIPASHGFGGITGGVKLILCDDVYIDDLYVQNQPSITDINALVSVKNTGNAPVIREVVARVIDRSNPSVELARAAQKNVSLAPGLNVVTIKVSAPNAKPWDIEHPNLNTCEASIAGSDGVADTAAQTFGFRWFEPSGIGKDASFRLNGKRIVLRSAISWGFFPINGIYATDEMATRQITVAKSMGLNMLNFHRAIGEPVIFEKADELGLLYYEEPGGYKSGDSNPFAQAMIREKLLRMVKRDRSHPCVAIYSMANEAGDDNDTLLKIHERDIADAHAIDPSRVIIRTSSFAIAPDINTEESFKMNMRPFDSKVYLSGWFDHHHAGGPAVWNQSFYKGPTQYYNRTDDTSEIVFWGEEGAISTPPRLGLIKEELAKEPRLGWDGAMYQNWYTRVDDFLRQYNLRSAFPTVDSFCESLGDVSMEHQGRKIQLIRLGNVADAYCINGWESEIIENHSGVVDCFRNPKGDPSIMAYYGRPLYVAVMPRNEVVELPGKAVVDFYLINEKNLKGPKKLSISINDPAGNEVFKKQFETSVSGGDMYGELIANEVTLPLTGFTGKYSIAATLSDEEGHPQATGHDQVLGVDYKSEAISGTGAVWDGPGRIRRFLSTEKNLDIPEYADNLGKLDWVVAARAPSDGEPAVIPVAQLRDSTGRKIGLSATFFDGTDFAHEKHRKGGDVVDIAVADGAPPDPAVSTLENYGVRWEGQVIAPVDGDYRFTMQASGQVTLEIDGQKVIQPVFDEKARIQPIPTAGVASAPIHLSAKKPVSIKVEWQQGTGAAHCELLWTAPNAAGANAANLIARVQQGRTNLVVVESADAWMRLAKEKAQINYDGSFIVGSAWSGGIHFVKQHPLFKDLPANGAMDWPYQAVVHNGKERMGLRLSGNELVAGAFHANMPDAPLDLGTAVGIVPCGKGFIVVSTLDICGNISSADTSTAVARKLLCNFINYAATRPK